VPAVAANAQSVRACKLKEEAPGAILLRTVFKLN